MKKIIIHLLDEVNCKISGLEPVDIRKCVNTLKFEDPKARHTPAVRLGRWDGKVNFFSVGGGTQINLLDRILPHIESAGYEIEIDDQRNPFNFNVNQIDENVISDCLWPKDHATHANQPIVLRQHQVDIINNFLSSPQGIQVAPTSAGKGITIAALCRIVEHLGRTIVIVPNKSLVNQTREEFRLLGLDVGVYFGDEKQMNKQHTICTWQSLSVLLKDTKSGKKGDGEDIISLIDGVNAIICDEVHGAKANELKELLTKVFHHIPIRWGLTGTMPKLDFEALSIVGSLGKVISTIKASTLQENGVMSNCNINVLQIQDDRKFGDYHGEYQYLVNDPDRQELIAGYIENIGDTGNTLVLVQNINTGENLERLIPGAKFLQGADKVADRKEEYDTFATENNLVLIATYGIASTGINIPRIYNLVLIEPGKSFVKTIQSIGRSLRRATDKDHAVIYDICSSCKYSKRHLTSRKEYYRDAGYPFQVIKVTKD